MQVQNVKPRYEVERVEGTITVSKMRRNMASGMNEVYTVEEPYGFNVYFPAGHSIRVATEAELHRLGFDIPPDMVDMETGDVLPTAGVSLKQHVQRRAGASHRRPDTGAVDAAQGG